MKFGDAHKDAIDRPQMQKCRGQHAFCRGEGDAAALRRGGGYAEGAEFCCGERLETGRGDGERIECHTR